MSNRPIPLQNKNYRGLLACLALVAGGARLAAQTPAESQSAAPAQTTQNEENQTVTLSPFEVQTTQDKGYAALNSNSITQFNTQLNKLPVSADILDQQFMSDVAPGGAGSVEELIQTYSAGSGSANSNPGSTAGNSQGLDRNGNSFISLRGLTAPTMQRDGFLPLNTFFNSGSTGTGFTSAFDTEQVDIVNGPQALLYGVGGAGGVVNLVSKRARFDQPSFADLTFQVSDQYGHKLGILDYGMGTDEFAVRVALTNQDIGDRRVDDGGPMDGEYAQIAFKVGQKTIVRLEGEQTVFFRQVTATGVTLTAPSSTFDIRNGDELRYLLATNQLVAPANGGPAGAGYIGGGAINWNNVDSYAGDLDQEYTRDTFGTIVVDTNWNDWLSSEVDLGYRNEIDDDLGGGPSLLSPTYSTNTTGTWAVSQGSLSDLYEPMREKVIRASVVANNDLGWVKSETVLGADYTRSDGDVITYGFVKADSNFNPVSSGGTADNGYTYIPTVVYAAPNGPVEYPLWPAFSQHVTYNGVNYTRVLENDTVASKIGPGNPLGLSGTGSGDHRIGREINKGIYLANDSDWLGGRLETLLGVRVGDSLEVNQLEASPPSSPSYTLTPEGKENHGITSFNFGANYGLLPWLRPYIEVSDSFDPPAVDSADPYGNPPDISHGIGEEAGLKVATPDAKVSGSLAFFHTESDNEQYSFTSTLTNDINPTGLNGRYQAPSNFINVDRETQGIDATFTANPTPELRIRASAAYVHGTVNSYAAYGQLYNDQFNENAAGDVTFADGDLVYVAPTYNSKAQPNPLVANAANAPAGYVPLTVAMMNNSASPYYANPVAVTGAINSSSAAANVLRALEPGTGSPILTGVTGLPISKLQIAPLASSPPVGTIVVAEPGDISTGFPEYSGNVTAVYTFDHGWFDGFGFGGTATASWKQMMYYYYPNGVSNPDAPRVPFYFPMLTRFDGIFRYTHKFGRVRFTTQLNIYNMFNHYHVVILPNAVTGWSGVDGATFDQQPRVWRLTNTLEF